MTQAQINQLSAAKAGDDVIAMAAQLGEVEHAYTCASCGLDCDGAWIRIKDDWHRHYMVVGGLLVEVGGEECIPF